MREQENNVTIHHGADDPSGDRSMTDLPGPGLNRRQFLALGGATLGAASIGGLAPALAQVEQNDDSGDARQYRVTVTNLTRGQPFTPPAVAIHRPDVEVFAVGDPANEPTRQLAENGNLDPLLSLVEGTNSIRGAAVGSQPLVPEDDPANTGLPYYTELRLSADASAKYLTVVSMLIATNDGIVGLDTVELPEAVNESRTYYANGYDVGTEQNTERFEDLVPPAKTLILGGQAEGTGESNPAIAEDDVIRPHPGIQGTGNLPPSVYDWREPAAVVQVERVDGFQQEFSTTLSGQNEVPPVETEASGEATFVLTQNGEGIEYEVTVENIENVVAAHIHCGEPDENGPVGVTLYQGDPVSEDGVLAEDEVTAPDDGNDCGWENLADVVDAMRDGSTYVNVHTEANPAGEIRGQIL